MPRATSSLDVIYEEVQREREEQLRHFESLDSKAGLMLGFAGVLVALGSAPNPLAVAGKLFAVAAAGWSAAAFFPRKYASVDLQWLRNDYIGRSRAFTTAYLLDTHIRTVSLGHVLLRDKALRLKIAAGHGLVSILLACWGILRA